MTLRSRALLLVAALVIAACSMMGCELLVSFDRSLIDAGVSEDASPDAPIVEEDSGVDSTVPDASDSGVPDSAPDVTDTGAPDTSTVDAGCTSASECPPGQACAVADHQCTTACSATQPCNGVCCTGTACAVETATACGVGGSTCQNCVTVDAGAACVSGSCGCNLASDCPVGESCSPALHTCVGTCSSTQPCNGGCCNGGTCSTGLVAGACGDTGGTCTNCAGQSVGTACVAEAKGGTCGCNSATTDCPANVLCSSSHACETVCSASVPCSGGCCSIAGGADAGTCTGGESASACGTGGAVCAPCAAGSCSGSTLTSAASCPSGTCAAGTPSACPNNFLCASGTACGTSCSGTTTGCIANTTCVGGTKCLLNPGQPCSSNGACASDVCDVGGDGDCCAAACIAGACGATSCNGSGACVYPLSGAVVTGCSGICDGAGHCEEGAGGACTANNQCESDVCGVGGTGNCCAAACLAGACGATSCNASGACVYPLSGATVAGCAGICDGAGHCEEAGGGTCTSNSQCESDVCGIAGTGNCCTAACVAGACGATSCDATGACVYPLSGATVAGCSGICDGTGHCEEAGGGTCTSNSQCESNVCGIAGTGNCCTAACVAGACGATSCDATGACVYPLSGATVAGCSGICDGTGHCEEAGGGTCTSNSQCESNVCGIAGTGNCCAAACTAGVCGATGCDVSGACSYPATACAATSCTGSTLTTFTTCNAGACTGGGTPAACPGDFACNGGGTACLLACGTDDAAGDANCATGFWCDGVVAGACQAPQGTGGPCTRDSQCTNGCDTGTGQCN